MQKKYLVWGLAFLVSFSAVAETVVIGCTTKCTGSYSKALKKVSEIFKTQLTVLDLSATSSPDLEKVDGIVIPGGVDIDPKYYLSEVEEELRVYTRKLDHLVEYTSNGKKRDPFEFGLLGRYFKDRKLEDLPVLGICRGMQMLAVSQGIPLYVDIKTELGIRNRRDLKDQINVSDSDSILRELFPGLSFLAVKNHHQGVRMDYYLKNSARWPNVKLTAVSNTGLIAEGLEFNDRPVLGVQFHPEEEFTTQGSKIFSWLVRAAMKRKESRKLP